MNTNEKLNRLHELRTAIQMAVTLKQEEIDQILTPEIMAQVDGIRAKWNDTTESMIEEVATLESEIEDEVLETETTVKSEHIMAVYNKGRVSWDSKKLDDMMALIHQLEQARKVVGDPTVSFRYL